MEVAHIGRRNRETPGGGDSRDGAIGKADQVAGGLGCGMTGGEASAATVSGRACGLRTGGAPAGSAQRQTDQELAAV